VRKKCDPQLGATVSLFFMNAYLFKISYIYMKTPMNDKEQYFNRDLSWLEFNSRVLSEALDDRNPSFERLRFLGIFQSNLDEYFMKRIGSLYSHARVRFRERLLPMIWDCHDCLEKELRPALKKQGILLAEWKDLNSDEKARAKHYYESNVFPVLTPLSVDPGHPFPFLSNLSSSLGIILRNPDQQDELFARVKIPSHFPQWIRIDGKRSVESAKFISILDLITQNLDTLFQGMEILEVMPFRITRNTNVERDEEDADDLLELITEEIKERRFGDVVRLEHGKKPNPRMLEFLREELHLDEDQVYEVPGFLDYTGLKAITDLARPDLKFNPWIPSTPSALADPDRDLFSVIRQQDLLVHHPYESFSSSVERFIRSAVDDPKVIAVKMTLYRTGADSPFIPLLIRAAEEGKHVVCVVELKARFDEEKNIVVAQRLENAGVHVVYGIVGMKTHCKLALVVRQEGESVTCYSHIGTGNYHSVTARSYTDLGLFTCDPKITADVVDLFHYLTGRSKKSNYHRLLVAPLTMKSGFLQRIEREMAHAKKGNPARIIAKINALEDRDITQALYAASKVGVKIDVIVRGFCCLRPKVKGLSENIRVVSVIGRFLEHSRVFFFQNGEKNHLKGDFLIGSADWMHRNLDARVEAVVPIEDRNNREKIWDLLTVLLSDDRQGWELQSNGDYVREKTKSVKHIGTHAYLMAKARNRF
jgi:polyphosphate kinase